MTGREFAVALFHQFGDWPGDGMKSTVADYFGADNLPELDRLFKWILRYYQPKRQGPPVLAEILAFQRELPMAQGPPRIEAPREEWGDTKEGDQLLRELMNKLTKKAKRGKKEVA